MWLTPIIPKILLGIILFLAFTSGGNGSMSERKLYNDLFMNYNVLERPVENSNDAITVNFGITLIHIIDLNEKAAILQSNLWLTIKWNDFNLRWDPKTYGNISDIRVPSNTDGRLWKPDIFPYNSAGPELDPTTATDAVIKSDGNTTIIAPGIFTTTCKLDFTWYPFDEQKCNIKFGSWTSDGGRMDLQLEDEEGGDISSFVKNSEWELIGLPARRNVIYYSCCPEPYVDVTFTVHVKRRGDALYAQAQILNVLICLTIMLSFLTSPVSGHKLTLAILSLLMGLWIVVEVQSPLPREHTSVLVYYFRFLLLVNYIGLAANVITLYVFHKFGSMPKWARTIFMEKVPSSLPIICPSTNKPGGQLLKESSERGTPPRNTESDSDSMAMRDWAYLACMLDRVFFFVFMVIIIVLNAVCFPTF